MLRSDNKFRPLEVVLVGPAFSGKTNLMSAHVCEKSKKFSSGYRPTVGADFVTCHYDQADEKSKMIRIWDSSWKSQVGSFPTKHIEGAPDLYIACMDLSNVYSPLDIENIFNDNELKNIKSTYGILLVGTKSDKERAKIDVDAMIAKLKPYGEVRYVETSAKNFADGNVEKCFQVAREMLAASPKLGLAQASKPVADSVEDEVVPAEASKKTEVNKASVATLSFICKQNPQAKTLTESIPDHSQSANVHLVIRLHK